MYVIAINARDDVISGVKTKYINTRRKGEAVHVYGYNYTDKQTSYYEDLQSSSLPLSRPQRAGNLSNFTEC